MPSFTPCSRPSAPELAIEGLEVRYQREPGAEPTLAVDRLAISPGERVGLTGPSGSGKTTLLHVMAGIERPHSGSVRWGQIELTKLDGAASARWRRLNVGLVFQDFQLVRALSAIENVLLPWRFDHFAAAPWHHPAVGQRAQRAGLGRTDRVRRHVSWDADCRHECRPRCRRRHPRLGRRPAVHGGRGGRRRRSFGIKDR